MGGSQSQSPSLTEADVVMGISLHLKNMDSFGAFGDFSIDNSLLMYSGLDSTAVLQDYSSQMLKDVARKGPSFVASFGSSLAALKGVPNAVGLGALVISMALEIAIGSSRVQNSDSPLNMVRRVFAEEKAAGVRDSMEEYLKRLRIHLHDPTQALQETTRLEQQLFGKLTSLKNSMLEDNQMSPPFMKHWTNGAAFHVQMIIHEARLKLAENKPNSQHKKSLTDMVKKVTNTVEQYQNELKDLLKKLFKASEWSFSVDYADIAFMCMKQTKELIEYFATLKKNTKELIMQHQTFNVGALKTR